MKSTSMKSLFLFAASMGAIAIASAACSGGGGGGSSTPTPSATPTPGASDGSATVMLASSNLTIGGAGSAFAACGLGQNQNLCAIDFQTTVSNTNNVLTVNDYIEIVVDSAWANGSVDYSAGNGAAEFFYNEQYDATTFDTIADGIGYYSTSGSITLASVPTTNGTHDGATFDFTDPGSHTWFALGTGAQPSLTGGAATSTGTLDSGCFSASGC